RTESLELCQRAREAGALAALGGLLLVAADTAFRLGDWDAADTAALEAIRVAGEVGQPAIVGWVLTIRVRILAAQGRHEEARAAAWSATTSSRPSPPRSRSTTSGRCRSSGPGRCSPSGAGCIAPGGAPRRAIVSYRRGPASSSCAPAPGPRRPRPSCTRPGP